MKFDENPSRSENMRCQISIKLTQKLTQFKWPISIQIFKLYTNAPYLIYNLNENEQRP